jgi:hypothetical protein
VGRLETGTRTVSVKWLNRIAAALGVTAADLVQLPERADIPVAALLGPGGAHAPRREAVVVPPQPASGLVALLVESGVGDYRAGDQLWCERLAPEDFASGLNRDMLFPRPAGRFLFGRLIGRDPGKVQLLPLGPGARQQVFADPPWGAIVRTLVRAF